MKALYSNPADRLKFRLIRTDNPERRERPMKVTIHYECRFGFRHSQEETTASKVIQAARVLSAAGCTIKAVTINE